MYATAQELANELKLTKARVSQLAKEGRLDFAKIKTKDGKIRYDKEKVIERFKKNENEIIEAYMHELNENSFNFDLERARKTRFEADIKELQLQVKKGMLVEATKVANEAFKCAYETKSKLMLIPQRVSTTLAAMKEPNEIKNFLLKEISICLKEISESLESLEKLGEKEKA